MKAGKKARPHVGGGGGTSVRLEACSLPTVFLRVEPRLVSLEDLILLFA